MEDRANAGMLFVRAGNLIFRDSNGEEVVVAVPIAKEVNWLQRIRSSIQDWFCSLCGEGYEE